MDGNYVLDTNIVIAFFAGDKKTTAELNNPGRLYHLPGIVVGELCYGAFNSKNADDNIRRIFSLTETLSPLSCDIRTAEYYGRIKTQLGNDGKPIPENDIWIAALAMQYNSVLVTRDIHFREVKMLQFVQW